MAYSCGRSVVTPFFASTGGYGIYYDTDSVGQIQFRGSHDGMTCNDSNSRNPLCKAVSAIDRVQVCFKASSLDYNVFAGTPAQVIAAYRLTVGRMPVPSHAEFALIKWRDSVVGSDEILDDITQLRRLGIPLGSVLLDNPWETDKCLGTLRFDPDRFANPASLIRQVHRSGVRFMVWVSPWVTASTKCRALSQFPAGTTFLTPQGWHAVDFTSELARSAFERRIAALVHLGVDGFKGDRGDETDFEGIAFANGHGTRIHNLYSEQFVRSVLAGARSAGERSPVTMFRAGWTGTVATGAGVWTGDQTPDFGGMQDAIRSLLSLGASGFALTGSDVGGYASGTNRFVLTRKCSRAGHSSGRSVRSSRSAVRTARPRSGSSERRQHRLRVARSSFTTASSRTSIRSLVCRREAALRSCNRSGSRIPTTKRRGRATSSCLWVVTCSPHPSPR